MPYREVSLYPMLGTGAFFAMFMTGVVVGYEIGFTCFPMLMSGMLFGAAGAIFVARLETSDLPLRKSNK